MKTAFIVLAVVAAGSVIEGCAVDADTQGAREERTYITGSNIARKQHSGEVSVMSAEAYERARSSVTPPVPMGAGGGR